MNWGRQEVRLKEGVVTKQWTVSDLLQFPSSSSVWPGKQQQYQVWLLPCALLLLLLVSLFWYVNSVPLSCFLIILHLNYITSRVTLFCNAMVVPQSQNDAWNMCIDSWKPVVVQVANPQLLSFYLSQSLKHDMEVKCQAVQNDWLGVSVQVDVQKEISSS